jgi:hypothetical protein
MNDPKMTRHKTLRNLDENFPITMFQLKEALNLEFKENSVEANKSIKLTKFSPVFSKEDSHLELAKDGTIVRKNLSILRRHTKKRKENTQQSNKTPRKASFLTFVNTSPLGPLKQEKDLSRAEVSILDERRIMQQLINKQLDESKLLKKTMGDQAEIAKLDEEIEKNIKQTRELRQRLYELGNNSSATKFDQEKMVHRQIWYYN